MRNDGETRKKTGVYAETNNRRPQIIAPVAEEVVMDRGGRGYSNLSLQYA